MRKTKIVCTLGPSSRDEAVIERLALSGMDVARLNMSHGDLDDHRGIIDAVKRVRKRLGKPIALMLDTKGPEIRLGVFPGGPVLLKRDAAFTLSALEIPGNETAASVSYAGLPGQVSKGDAILINDGSLELRVEETSDTQVVCRVISGGKVDSHKGVNLPGKYIDLPFLGEKDKKDVAFGVEKDVDFIAASFVRRGEDVGALRKLIDSCGGNRIKIISKIENSWGVAQFNEILRLSDGIMIARGDMGVEVNYELLPGLQKRFIRKCYQAGKMVITATQMLESMISSPKPTRAEITDVANAVFDGTSAVMLSGETASGAYPIETVRVMAKIAEQAERDAFDMGAYRGVVYEMDAGDQTNAVCDAACTLARDVRARAIIALTNSGFTARRMSKFRPQEPIIAVTPEEKTFHQLALSWGVCPVMSQPNIPFDALFRYAVDRAGSLGMLSRDDVVVIASGLPLDISGHTNLIKVEVV